MPKATHLSFVSHMNKGFSILDSGVVAEYRHLPGAYHKLQLNFKSISGEAEENALLFYRKEGGKDSFCLRQYDDETVPDDAKFIGHMTVVSNIPSSYSATLNPTHSYDV
tara:strand:- start:48 stop:374 length:327 start_codon:yes stop_codon:yes gene_type:complete